MIPPEISSLIPEPYRPWLLLIVALSPLVTRGLHALANGRGIKGSLSAIWFGTNTPTSKPTDQPPSSTP